MALLPLTQGYCAVVDDEDLERLSQWKWWITGKHSKCYATRYDPYSHKVKKQRYLHYEVLQLPQPLGEDLCIDHINRDCLDCRKSNLRVCTRMENRQNSGPPRTRTTSIYKGVSYCKASKRWRAEITWNHRHYFLGQFKTEYQALVAYNIGSLIFHGRFGFMNNWVGPSPGHECKFLKEAYAELKKRDPDFVPPRYRPGRHDITPLPTGMQLLLPFEE